MEKIMFCVVSAVDQSAYYVVNDRPMAEELLNTLPAGEYVIELWDVDRNVAKVTFFAEYTSA